MTAEKKSRSASGSNISKPQSVVTLPQDMIGELLDAQRKLHDIIPALDAAPKCGIECKEQLADHRRQMDQITEILKHYGGINP